MGSRTANAQRPSVLAELKMRIEALKERNKHLEQALREADERTGELTGKLTMLRAQLTAAGTPLQMDNVMDVRRTMNELLERLRLLSPEQVGQLVRIITHAFNV